MIGGEDELRAHVERLAAAARFPVGLDAQDVRSCPLRFGLSAGGRDKGLDLDLLGQVIARHAHALVVIGEASQAISSAARRHGVSTIEAATTMEDAVERAYKLCPAPGVVLLSPACTSFDMFNNAEHRGDVFAASVNSLQRRLDEALMGLGEEGA